MNALAELETAEYRAVDALARLAPGSREHTRLRGLLDKARAAKAVLLARSPDILRKGSGGKLGVSLPVPAAAVAKAVREAADRMAEERRLGARSGMRRYRAPAELRGKPITLVDGRTLDVPQHGVCEVADGRHPAARDETNSPAHHQLVALGFEPLADRGGDEADAIKAALHRPIAGDQAFLRWYGQRAGR